MSSTSSIWHKWNFMRDFQFKMALQKIIQIPCHHVLANEIALNLKYRIGLKEIFNITLGIGIIKKLPFLFVFSTYLPVFSLKFWSRELGGCGIKFHIQWVPTWNTFDAPLYPQNKKYLKMRDDDVITMFFQVFLVLGVALLHLEISHYLSAFRRISCCLLTS